VKGEFHGDSSDWEIRRRCAGKHLTTGAGSASIPVSRVVDRHPLDRLPIFESLEMSNKAFEAAFLV
jgi:hypothetical protein